jgi:acetyl esterase/lipase
LKGNTMTSVKLIFSALLLPALVSAADEPPVVALWPGGAPGSEGKTAREIVAAGRVSSVHNPSITVYLPSKDTATGAAVIVCPGGGHSVLAIDHEGYNVAKWLSEHGIAAFVLKYRLARETNSTYKVDVHALADTQRAIRLVRSRAAEWGVVPARVGLIGFSAGGELVSLASSRFDNGNESAADPVEHQNSKPSFQALIYPGGSRNISVTKDSPPAFLACGYGDRPDISEGLANVYLQFKKAGVPAELHIYASAGHGFGLRDTNHSASGGWPMRFYEWMADRKFIERKP